MAEPYVGQLSDLVKALGLSEQPGVDLECRHFFSGAALYADGTICASLTPVGLAMKRPPDVREVMLAEGLDRLLRYFDGGKVKKDYVLLPEGPAVASSALSELFLTSFWHVRGE